MICQQCGEKNDPDAVFCVNCSNPLLQSCPSCGIQNPAHARFCKQCGNELGVVIAATQSVRLQDLQKTAPKFLQEKLLKAEEEIEGQRKPVTILFADIVGSTSIAEKLDPEEWKEVVQGSHHRISEAIHRYEGTIAQLLGDGVMAFFGAPLTHEDDPERAVRAGLDIQESIMEYRRGLVGYIDDFHMRVGIHAGEVVVGPVGTDERTEYLAIGDAVNLAARLEGKAKPDQVLISDSCARFVEYLFDLGNYQSIKVKGKTEPVKVVVVLGIKSDPGLARGLAGVRTPFVGREGELAQLEDALLSLSQGQGQILSVLGDAGIGKTRLLEQARESILKGEIEESASRIDPTTFRWLEGRSLSYGGSLSFWTINQVLLDDLGLSDGSPQVKIKATLRKRLRNLFDEEKAVRILPYLANLLGLPQEGGGEGLSDSMDGESIKLQTTFYMAEYFEKIATLSPTIVILEDLHWADPSSLEMLTHLLPLTDRLPITFVLLMRIDPDHGSWELRSIAQKELPHRLTEIHLRRLGNRESQILVEQLLRPDVIPQDIRELILERAEGNPFYLEEVVRHLLESELIYENEGELIASDRIEEVGLPETLQGVLLARIDRLEEDIRGTLQMASVIGKTFLFKLLEAISDAERQLEYHLTQLQRADLVRERTRLPDVEYIFKHSLTQEAAYNSLLIDRRRAFHLQVGEAIEELFPDRIEEFLGLLAHHFSSANALEKAGDYLVRAGKKAGGDAAINEAIEYYSRGIEVYEQLDDQMMIGKLKMYLGAHSWEIGDRQSALEYLNSALSTFENAEETTELAEVLGQISRMHMVASEYDQAIAVGEQALVLAENLGTQEIIAHTLNTVGSAWFGKGDMEHGLSKLDESLRLALDLDLKFAVYRTYFNRGSLYISAGRYEEALADYEAYHEYAHRKRDGFNEAFGLMIITIADWYCSRWASALNRLPLFKDEMVGIWKVWEHLLLGKIENDLGQPEIACRDLESLLSVALRAEEIQTSVPYLGELARAYVALGRDSEATHMVEQYLALIDDNPYFHDGSIASLLFSCQWFAAQGDKVSLEKCRASVNRLERAFNQLPFPEANASFEEGRGYLALANGHHTQAAENFRNALEVWEALGRHYDQARTLGSLGNALKARNDLKEAVNALDESLQLIGILAEQLVDEEIKSSFLDSQLVTEIRQVRAAIESHD